MKSKPTNCRYPDCFDCQYKDCRYDAVEYADIKRQDQFDKDLEIVDPHIEKRRRQQAEYSKSEMGKIRFRRYWQSDKGKATQKRFLQTDKFKEAQKRYRQSEKGKQTQKRHSEKMIESGRNADYCKVYYERHREEILRKKREKREQQRREKEIKERLNT